MPIDRTTFETTPPARLDAPDETPTVQGIVRTFLATHPDTAFTTAEIRGATGVPRGSIGPALARLEDAAVVVHRGDYWAIDSDASDSAGEDG
jgi:hypothetical protein